MTANPTIDSTVIRRVGEDTVDKARAWDMNDKKNQEQPMAKAKPKTWDDEFQRHVCKGCDHADAAYRADEWERLKAGRTKRADSKTAPEGFENE